MSTTTSARPKIDIDLARSHGAYAYDRTTDRLVFDMFGMFASLPLGYGRLSDDFDGLVCEWAGVKIPLGAVDCAPARKFRELYASLPANRHHPHAWFSSTGALAVEAAVKAAIQHCGYGTRSRVISLTDSFHGVYGYGGALASWYGPAAGRVEDYPQAPLMAYNSDDAAASLTTIEHSLIHDDIAAVIVEPIQCSAGDRVVSPEFLLDLRAVCTDTGTPLIFDEIQTGWGVTGKFWCWQRLGLVPDIVVFGKKAQVSGFLSTRAFDPAPLMSTWAGDVIDMIRAAEILARYEREDTVAQVEAHGAYLEWWLRSMCPNLTVRRTGLLIALDFESTWERDRAATRLWAAGVLVNPTGNRTIRLRPPLNIDQPTCDDFLARIAKVANWEPLGLTMNYVP